MQQMHHSSSSPSTRARVSRLLAVLLTGVFLCLTFCLAGCASGSGESGGSTDTSASVSAASLPEEPTLPGTGLTVCIDAGHSDTPNWKEERIIPPDYDLPEGLPASAEYAPIEPGGTSGNLSGPEYAVNLDVALKLQKDLEAQGFTVVMCRTDNSTGLSSADRAKIANDCNADLFIRLHCDGASDGGVANGFLTLVPTDVGYQSENDLYEKSQDIGEQMHESIVEQLGVNDRGIQYRKDMAGFNWCTQPSVLFEMGVMTTPSDDEKLATDEYQEELASAICQATVEAIGAK